MNEKEKEDLIKELENLSEEELTELQKQVEGLINKLNNISESKDGE